MLNADLIIPEFVIVQGSCLNLMEFVEILLLSPLQNHAKLLHLNILLKILHYNLKLEPIQLIKIFCFESHLGLLDITCNTDNHQIDFNTLLWCLPLMKFHAILCTVTKPRNCLFTLAVFNCKMY